MILISSKVFLCLLVILVFVPDIASASNDSVHVENTKSNIYVTWEGSEPDKGASAWLIKNYVNKNARFKMVPKGDFIEDGIPFDVPESEFRRTHQFSTFETIQRKYAITDSTVIRLGKVIHDLEINTWGKKIAEETPLVEQALWELRQLFGKKIVPIDCNVELFGVIFGELKKNNIKNIQINIPHRCVELAKYK